MILRGNFGWFLFSALALLGGPSVFATVDKTPPAVVSVRKVSATELFDLLSFPARITPRINTNLLSETDGIVTQILAPLGQRVSKGQKILSIRHTDPVYQYAPAAVVAPVAGVVSALEVTEGTQVERGQRVASVTDPNRVSIQVEVPALDLRLLSKGMSGEFRVSGREQVVPVRIRGVSPFVDPGTGTATCEIEIDSKADPSAQTTIIMPGVVGRVAFKANKRKGFQIPDHAISYKNDEPFARVVEEGKAKRVAVKLGVKQQGLVEILEGLKENQMLVERASRFVADGEAVTVQGDEKTEGANK